MSLPGQTLKPESMSQKPVTRKLQKFFLKLSLPGKQLNLYMSKQRDGAEYLAKLRSNNFNWRSWFVYDARTRSIRLASKPQFALATMKGIGFQKGYNAVFRSYTNQLFRETFVVLYDK